MIIKIFNLFNFRLSRLVWNWIDVVTQLADYLTTEFMDEQLKGHRNIAGLINTLQGVLKKQPRLGEWIFDNNLSKSIAV